MLLVHCYVMSIWRLFFVCLADDNINMTYTFSKGLPDPEYSVSVTLIELFFLNQIICRSDLLSLILATAVQIRTIKISKLSQQVAGLQVEKGRAYRA